MSTEIFSQILKVEIELSSFDQMMTEKNLIDSLLNFISILNKISVLIKLLFRPEYHFLPCQT